MEEGGWDKELARREGREVEQLGAAGRVWVPPSLLPSQKWEEQDPSLRSGVGAEMVVRSRPLPRSKQ